jgi:ATPase subunit of ABC transporter with duplicated ATPase domains
LRHCYPLRYANENHRLIPLVFVYPPPQDDTMHIGVNQLSYQFPGGQTLFNRLTFTIPYGKTGLVGNNGSGKSTLLKLLAGSLAPTSGTIAREGKVAVMPQVFDPYYEQSVAQALGVAAILRALQNILAGQGSEVDFLLLENNWDIEDRIEQVLRRADLLHLSLDRTFASLSGGEMSRLLFAALLLQAPDFILLDEPTNHLDQASREKLYQLIATFEKGLLIVSHDRTLLRLMDSTMELSPEGIHLYGGNYDFYEQQKQVEQDAALHQYQTATRERNKSVRQQQKAIERQEKRNSRGEKSNRAKGVDKMALHILKGAGENTLARIKSVHSAKVQQQAEKVAQVKARLPQPHTISIDLESSTLHAAKRVIVAENINYRYQENAFLWPKPLSFTLLSQDRLAILGNNGTGKSTLVQLITGTLVPATGKLHVGTEKIGLIDQQLLLLNNALSVLENLRLFAPSGMAEHELRIRLGRFLFYGETVFKKAACLSGGERMRLALACLLATGNAPQLLVLDEPTNNLDLASIAQLTSTLTQYQGAMVVISHDQHFLEQLQLTQQLYLSR